MQMIAQNGSGVVLYMSQEGRGIGIANKLKAYKLQENGLDTVQANEELGFKDDLRDYGVGAQILCDLGIKDIQLMTNNPRKIVGLEGYGLSVVKRVPIKIESQKHNKNYLGTKEKLGHMLEDKMKHKPFKFAKNMNIGGLESRNYRVGIVVATFNGDISNGLLEGTLKGLAASNVKKENIAIYTVDGCVEIPIVAQRLADKKIVDVIICLGSVIKAIPHILNMYVNQ